MAETDYQVPNNIANGDTPDATRLMGNFEYIENALNDFNGENIITGSILDAGLATNPETIRDETMHDFVVSGLTSADPGATLTGVIAAGIAYIEGVRVSVNSYSNAYTASKDCYVDLDKNGEFHVTDVANGAGVPALYTNSTRICKFVTNGTEITSYTDMRVIGNCLGHAEITSNFTTTATGDVDVTGLSVSVNVPVGRRINIKARARYTASTSTAGSLLSLKIKEATTTLAENLGVVRNSGDGVIDSVEASLTPNAGNHTYKLSVYQQNSGTATVAAATTAPAFIEVTLV